MSVMSCHEVGLWLVSSAGKVYLYNSVVHWEMTETAACGLWRGGSFSGCLGGGKVLGWWALGLRDPELREVSAGGLQV